MPKVIEQLTERQRRKRSFLFSSVLAVPSFLFAVAQIKNSYAAEPTNAEQLAQYPKRIEPFQEIALAATADIPFFERFKISTQAQQEDLLLYFPLYYAGQERYQVPWEYLWVMHEHETTASRNPYPQQYGYHGAMQRSAQFYPAQTAISTAKGFEFLETLPQRYTPPMYSTFDYQEILFAAWKIRKDADALLQREATLNDLQALEKAQYSYCAPENAELRIADFRKIRSTILNHQVRQELLPTEKN